MITRLVERQERPERPARSVGGNSTGIVVDKIWSRTRRDMGRRQECGSVDLPGVAHILVHTTEESRLSWTQQSRGQDGKLGIRVMTWVCPQLADEWMG